MSKYAPLKAFLAGSGDDVTMSLEAIADLVGGLPRSAHEYEAWWSNNDSTHSQCRSWNEAGYLAHPQLGDRSVRFTRESVQRDRV